MLEGYNSVDQKWESEGGTVEYVDNHGTLCTGCAASIGVRDVLCSVCCTVFYSCSDIVCFLSTRLISCFQNNGVGISGVGWNFKHRPGRVTNTAGQATFANIADCAK